LSLAACAVLVERGDPDRFQAVLAAPRWTREILLPLYAFNLEIARAPWVTAEPLIAEMRLEWWREVVRSAGSGAARAHEVAAPLHALIADFGLPREGLLALIDARAADIGRSGFEHQAALTGYLEATGGGLMWLAARALGAGGGAEAAVRDYGRAAALAQYLVAVPALTAHGRRALPDTSDAAVTGLARSGLAWLGAARQARRTVPRAVAPALLAGWLAGPRLTRAAADPSAVTAGALEVSEFVRRGRLLWQAATGRW
jgi:15-cis-phytoene synthase